MSGGQNIFNGQNPNAAQLGFGTNFSLLQNLSGGKDFFQFHFGAKARSYTSSSDSRKFGLITISPHLRMEMPRLYFGAGAAPLIWQRSEHTSGFDNYQKTPGLSFNAEIGLLWRVTPDFHLAIEGDADFVKTSAGTGPSPATQIMIVMRFYFKSDQNPNAQDIKFDGWRYPFGVEIWDN